MTLPKENLDNKAFEDLVKEAISRIPVYAPGWTDHNAHDPGITFIELFAWLTEMQIYRLNKINDKNYRKFLKLIGIPKLKPASAARVDVTFRLRSGFTQAEVPGGTLVAATDPVTGEDTLFRIEQDLTVIKTELSNELTILSHVNSGEVYINNTEANKNDNLYYYAFRPDERPKKDDELYIGFKDDPFKDNLDKGIVLAFYLQGDEPLEDEENSVPVPSGTLKWEYYGANDAPGTNDWIPVEDGEITDETRHFSVSGKITIKNANGMMKEKDIDEIKGFFWLRCSVKDEKEYHIPPKINRILLNTVSAVNDIPSNEIKFSSSGLPNFHIDLKYAPVLDNTLIVTTDEWTQVEDFDASKPGDRHYTVDFASGRVTFGNGINGKIPPKGTDNVTVSYCSGGGVRGNVKAKSITRILDRFLDEKVTVTNAEEASGGTEAETLEEAIQRARKELKEVTRAVTSADYEYLALNTPRMWVARAKALPRYHPSQDREVPGIISVVVVPESLYDNPIPDQNFLKAVYLHLDKHRLLTTEIFVIPPVYVEISVKATVVVKPKSLQSQVKKDVENKLEKFLHPVSGGFNGKGWPFGRSVYVSEIYEVIDNVEGVNYVESVNLSGKRKMATEYIDIPLTATRDISIPVEGLVYLDSEKTEIVAKEEN